MIIIVYFYWYHMELAYNHPPVCKKLYMLVSSYYILIYFSIYYPAFRLSTNSGFSHSPEVALYFLIIRAGFPAITE